MLCALSLFLMKATCQLSNQQTTLIPLHIQSNKLNPKVLKTQQIKLCSLKRKIKS
jgi:hypothetical protein